MLREQGFTSLCGAEQTTDARKKMTGCKSISTGTAERILPPCTVCSTVKIRLLVAVLSTFPWYCYERPQSSWAQRSPPAGPPSRTGQCPPSRSPARLPRDLLGKVLSWCSERGTASELGCPGSCTFFQPFGAGGPRISLRTEPGEGSRSHSQLAKADCSAAPYRLVILSKHSVPNAVNEEAAKFRNFASFLGKPPPLLLPGHARGGAAGREDPEPPRRRCWAGAKGSGQKFKAPTSSQEQGSKADNRSSPAPLPSGVTEGYEPPRWHGAGLRSPLRRAAGKKICAGKKKKSPSLSSLFCGSARSEAKDGVRGNETPRGVGARVRLKERSSPGLSITWGFQLPGWPSPQVPREARPGAGKRGGGKNPPWLLGSLPPTSAAFAQQLQRPPPGLSHPVTWASLF